MASYARAAEVAADSSVLHNFNCAPMKCHFFDPQTALPDIAIPTDSTKINRPGHNIRMY